MSILIKNATAITMNGREVINNAYLLTDGGAIKYIGEICPQIGDDTTVIDAGGAILMPAFVNMHTHLAMTYFRSYASDLPLDKWLQKVFVIEDSLDEEAIYYGALIACAEAMEHGAACVNDMYLNTFGTAQACLESGIRAYISRSVVDTDGVAGLERRMLENDDIRRKYNGAQNRIFVLPSAHAEYTCSCDALMRVYADAEKYGSPVHIHISETVKEVAGCMERHGGKTPLELLESLGLLEKAATIAAHCVAVNSHDIDIMNKYRVYPVHNPVSNLKLGSGISPVLSMAQAGIDVCIGTDGSGSNNNIDMFRELFVAAVLQKGYNKKADCVDAYSALKMATVNGAAALEYDGGRLEQGAAADILLLKKSPYLAPVHDPFGIVVYSASAANVDTLIVNGCITVKNGECITVDKAGAYNGFMKCCKKLFLEG